MIVIGEPNVGKTSTIQRYVEDVFSHRYKATIGVDFALKMVEVDAGTLVRLQLWDIAGQERFGSMTRVYYRDADAAVIVFDLTAQRTFEAVAKWKADVDDKASWLVWVGFVLTVSGAKGAVGLGSAGSVSVAGEQVRPAGENRQRRGEYQVSWFTLDADGSWAGD